MTLTARQTQVLACVADDMTNEQIARRLGIAPATVKNTLSRVTAVLGVSTRAGAVAAAFRAGILGAGDSRAALPADERDVT